ncbi:quinone oxidoreductase 1 isoform X1 [Labeo rohita]|uniref:Quinone oxidoreductase 1 isoform X1 n=1 Tax=Labeo rohita TaxID=84645 RepID=A0A498NJQ0_LABRO|nr:quinone oxidoreductase 1 isoform X1 [Labeo rohita]
MKGLYCKPGDQGDVKFILEDTNIPTNIGSHEVKVQVKSCALSPVDFKLYEDLKLEKEHVPVGREIAGVVLQVGPKVTFFQPDDEVVGILPLDAEQSGLCSVVVTDEYNLVQKPEKVSWFEAAAVIKDGLRAYTALHTLARMAAGQTVLVLDGAGVDILKDVMDKLCTGTFRPQLEDPVPLYEATVSMEMVQRKQARKRIAVKL